MCWLLDYSDLEHYGKSAALSIWSEFVRALSEKNEVIPEFEWLSWMVTFLSHCPRHWVGLGRWKTPCLCQDKPSGTSYVDTLLIKAADFFSGRAGTLCSCVFSRRNDSQGLRENCQRENICPSLFIYRSLSACWPKTTLTWMCHCFCRPLTWPLLLLLSPLAETGSWWGADAAAGPRCQPDSDDAGHHGPESVLLQCQTNDGEGPGPAGTLKTRTSMLIKTNDEPARRGNWWSNKAETPLSSSTTRRPGPLLSLSLWAQAPRLIWVFFFFSTSCCPDLDGEGFLVWEGWLALGVWVGLVSLSGLGGPENLLFWPTGFVH